jgi:hypothetical protein
MGRRPSSPSNDPNVILRHLEVWINGHPDERSATPDDIVASGDAGTSVNGVCLPVGDAELAALDARERNYERVDVTATVAEAPGRVWAYAGSTTAARSRRRRCAGFCATMFAMDAPWIESTSSAVATYRYLAQDEVLQIVFQQGRHAYDYPCDASMYDAFLSAESKGRFVERVLKPHAARLGTTPRRSAWRA